MQNTINIFTSISRYLVVVNYDKYIYGVFNIVIRFTDFPKVNNWINVKSKRTGERNNDCFYDGFDITIAIQCYAIKNIAEIFFCLLERPERKKNEITVFFRKIPIITKLTIYYLKTSRTRHNRI